MHKMNLPKDLHNQKYLNVEDAKLYYQISRGMVMNTAQKANAVRRIGRRVLIDKAVMDQYIESQASSEK